MTSSRHQGRARVRADARLRAAAPVHGPPTVSDRRRILVCDAESQTLHALRVVLHGAGFEVDATRNAAEALERGALRRPTAAIIELVLPDGDGVAVCRRLREWSAMPVILLSAVRDEDAQVRAFEAGADDYVTKLFRRANSSRVWWHICDEPSPAPISHAWNWMVSRSTSRPAPCAGTVRWFISHRSSSAFSGS